MYYKYVFFLKILHTFRNTVISCHTPIIVMDTEVSPFSSQPSHSQDPQHKSDEHPSCTISKSQAVKETKAMKRFKKIDEAFRLFGESLSSKERVYPAIEPPCEVIKSPLLAHQKEGLGWLVEKENSNDLPPFWEEREGKFVNLLTDYRTDNRPEPLRSGILADDKGLGKTLMMLSLIALDKSRNFGNGDDGKKSKKKGSGSRKRPKTEDVVVCDRLVTNATLVVCPPSALSIWTTQLKEHTVLGSLRTCNYYGPRTGDANELKMKDLVLTTYATLLSEDNLDESPLKKLEWRRIILDDAHAIKNSYAKQTKAVIRLDAKRRWAVTGAPIHNGSMDLFTLMEFLHFEPFSTRSYWLNLVQRSINIHEENALSRLQILLAALSLRRKDTKLAELLPPKIIEIHYVVLDPEELELYHQVHEIARNSVLSCIHRDQVVRYYSTLRNLVSLLSQVCSDMTLCPEDIRLLPPSNDIRDISEQPGLVKKLQAVENLVCPICFFPSLDVVITLCAHTFCRACILQTLQYSHSCPLCRHPLQESDLFSAPPLYTRPDSYSPSSPSSSITRPSSKTLALIELLVESRDQNPAVKSIVFSQFNQMLSLLQEHLKAEGFKTLRLDSLMNAKARAEVIEQFQSRRRGGPTVLLASLKVSTTGINLTAASRVYFMDAGCDSVAGEEIMDCVHRIGQKEAVKIVKFIAQDTIEEKMLEVQDEKKQIAETRFGNGSRGFGMGIDDIRYLMDV